MDVEHYVVVPTGFTTDNTTGDRSSNNNRLISSNTRKDNINNISYVELQKAILYTLDHRKLREEDKRMKGSNSTSTKRRSAVPTLWKEIQHGAMTGFAWLFVFLPALFYYIHQVIPRISRYRNSSSSPFLHALWKQYTPIAQQVSISLKYYRKNDIFYISTDSSRPHATDERSLSFVKKELIYPLEQVLDFASSSSEKLSSLNGLLWVHDEQLGRGYILFSDTFANRIWRWEVGNGPITIGRTLFMERSGCRSGQCSNTTQGSSCLTSEVGVSQTSNLIVCEVGEQRIVRIETDGARTPIVHLNSSIGRPYHVVYTPFGDLFLTTTNGLWKMEEAYKVPPIPARLSRASHYLTTDDKIPIQLMYSSLLQPYGLALSQDFKHIYVSDADPTNPIIIKLPVDMEDDDNDEEEYHDKSDLEPNNCSAASLDQHTVKGVLDGLKNDNVFFNASTLPSTLCCDGNTSSTPDSPPVGVKGLTVDQNGNVWATLSNAIVMLSSEGGKLLACICNSLSSSSQDTSPTDIAFGDDGYLYVTTETKLLRIKVKSKRLTVPNMVTGKKKNNQ